MGEWKNVRLGDCFDRVTRRNSENNKNVLTVSASYGLVNQKEFFHKIVASKDLRNYYLLHNGDFVYNKSYCDGYPMGAFKRLDNYDKGVVTSLYICFAPSSPKVCSDFYLHYFEAGMMNDALYNIAQEGARNHGLLNVGVDRFFDMPIPLPPLPAQRRIAAVLTAADEAISASRALAEKYAGIKAGLMQDLLGAGEQMRFADIADPISQRGKTGNSICINMDCIGSGTGELTPSDHADNASDKTAFQAGDVLYGKLRPYLRKYWLATFNGVCSSELFVFRPKPIVRKEYLYYIVSTAEFSKHSNALAYGTKMPRTSWKIIKEYIVNIPDLPQQDEIIRILAAADNQLRAEREHLAKLEKIKRGLMHDLLTDTVSADRLQEGTI